MDVIAYFKDNYDKLVKPIRNEINTLEEEIEELTGALRGYYPEHPYYDMITEEIDELESQLTSKENQLRELRREIRKRVEGFSKHREHVREVEDVIKYLPGRPGFEQARDRFESNVLNTIEDEAEKEAYRAGERILMKPRYGRKKQLKKTKHRR